MVAAVIDTAPTADELLAAALAYAKDGWKVLPLHTPINGICDCSAQENCKSVGKHPWTRNGLSDASTDELRIRRWWKERPIANIGLTIKDGYVVVDVDGDHGQQQLAAEQKPLVPTAVQSSGKGAHYVYRTREKVGPRSEFIPSSSEGAHDGVDLRGPGSYIVAAPSVHASGRVYEWSIPLSQVEIAPPWLEDVGRHSGGTTVGERSPVDFGVLLAGLPEGQRKWELYRAASKLRAADVPLDLAIMLAEQAAAACHPPLEPKEAERKVREAYAKYPPNASARDLPAGVTLLSNDSVMVEFESCRFVFSDLEKAGRELHAEMEVQNLLPGTPREPYIQRLNLLSMSARESCRREIEHVLGTGEKGHWTAILARAVAKAQDAFLKVDRSIRASDIVPAETLEFVIPDICVADGFSILFGAGCIAAGTMIDCPEGPRAVEALWRAGQPFNVWALGPSGPVLARASSPFLKGWADLYRFDLDSGRSITVTREHRFLTPSGWQYAGALQTGDRLASSAPVRPQTMTADDLAAWPRDALCSTRTAEGLRGGYSVDHRRYDRRLRPVGGSDRSLAPLPDDALGRILGGLHAGDPETRSGYSHPCQWSVPLSRSFPSRGAPSLVGAGDQVASARSTRPFESNPKQWPSPVWFDAEHATPEADLEEGSSEGDQFDSCVLPALDDLSYCTITAVSYVGYGPYFDLTVPTYANYSAEGVWNHNSAGKTFLLMKIAIAVSRGDSFLGRSTRKRNTLYIDCETGQKTFGYRLRRLLAGEGLGMEAAADIHYWWAQGLPLEDQVDAIKRCCEENEIEFICLDHIAAACSGDASEQAIASRFARAVGKIGLPMMALAHITSADMKNPDSVQKPFGSIFWENGARRTIFIMRQQEDESLVADLGLYPRKINDGGRTAPFGARLTFDDPSGPITLDTDDVRGNPALSTARGVQHVIFDLLREPMSVKTIAEAANKTERYVKDILTNHPRMFGDVSGHAGGGRGNEKLWARVETRMPYSEPEYDDYAETEIPF